MRIDAGQKFGGYRLASPSGFEAAWRVGAPEAERAVLILAGWFGAWERATLATDPGSLASAHIRAPSGPAQDVREHGRAGRSL